MNRRKELVTVVITCQIQPGKAEMAREEFSAIIKTVVDNEAACHGIDLHLDPEDPNRLLLIEYWDSKEAFTGLHMQTPHMLAFLRRAQQFLAEAPHFGFWQQFATAS
ncbi:MAG TPA: putative quinol monooxygenase [Pyrinomonadaceae bacterium]|nr:putative quinol monooxygenase [Pyrinomonadaceae bacterium]